MGICKATQISQAEKGERKNAARSPRDAACSSTRNFRAQLVRNPPPHVRIRHGVVQVPDELVQHLPPHVRTHPHLSSKHSAQKRDNLRLVDL